MKSFLVAVTLLLAFTAGPVRAVEPIHTATFGNTAVDGYDVVAYFDQGKPVAGSREFTTEWMGAQWRFASADHRAAFEAEPEKYAPRYGGYCAWAVAHDYTASGDPHAWSIIDGRLYLNYNRSVRENWLKEPRALIERGDRNWPGLVD